VLPDLRQFHDDRRVIGSYCPRLDKSAFRSVSRRGTIAGVSNHSILERMRESCDRFDAGTITAEEVMGEITSLAKSLDSIRPMAVQAARDFRSKVVYGCDLIGHDNDEAGGWKEINNAVSAMRTWISAELEKLGVNPPAPTPDRPSDSN